MAASKINVSNTNPAAPSGATNIAWQVSAPYPDPSDPTSQIVDVSGSTALVNFADEETPGGTIDGTNTSFTLAFSPNPPKSLQLFLNGVLQKPGGVDYTLTSGNVVIFVTAPSSGSILLAWYRH